MWQPHTLPDTSPIFYSVVVKLQHNGQACSDCPARHARPGRSSGGRATSKEGDYIMSSVVGRVGCLQPRVVFNYLSCWVLRPYSGSSLARRGSQQLHWVTFSSRQPWSGYFTRDAAWHTAGIRPVVHHCITCAMLTFTDIQELRGGGEASRLLPHPQGGLPRAIQQLDG